MISDRQYNFYGEKIIVPEEKEEKEPVAGKQTWLYSEGKGIGMKKKSVWNPNSSKDPKESISEGRIGRVTYATSLFFISLPLFLVPFLEKERLDGFSFLIFIGCTCLTLHQCEKRLHDLNLSGLHLVFAFVPLLNIFFGLYLLFTPGTVGSNQYGSDPRPQETVSNEPQGRDRVSWQKNSLPFSENPMQKIILTLGIIPIFIIGTPALASMFYGTPNYSLEHSLNKYPFAWIISISLLIFLEMMIWQNKRSSCETFNNADHTVNA